MRNAQRDRLDADSNATRRSPATEVTENAEMVVLQARAEPLDVPGASVISVSSVANVRSQSSLDPRLPGVRV